MQLVDEMVDLNELKLLELAKRNMDNETAEAVLALPEGKKSNWGMVAFLAICLDGAYDHCAWLDSDIFVHRGSLPWVDAAIQRHIEDPWITVGRPSHSPLDEDGLEKFSSRHFVYHRKGLQRLLPLKGLRKVSKHFNFEDLMNDNFDKLEYRHGVFMTSRGGSWVIHPPDHKSQIRHLLKACGSRSLTTLIAIMEQGSEHGKMAYKWHQRKNPDMMDAASWASHMRQQCSGQRFTNSSLPPVGLTASVPEAGDI